MQRRVFWVLGCLFVLSLILSDTMAAPMAANIPRPQQPGESDSTFQARRANEADAYTVYVHSIAVNPLTHAKAGGGGTGFIYRADENTGYIITNRHVVESGPRDAHLVELHFSVPGERFDVIRGEVVDLDEAIDFALIRFNVKDLKRAEFTLAPIPQNLAMLDELIRTGRNTFAYGNPLGGRRTFTKGVISEARNTQFSVEIPMIKTDTTINAGNSGGPLVDLETGFIVGINTQKFVMPGADNQGFAIPMDTILKRLAAFESGSALRPRGSGVLFLQTQRIPNGVLQLEGIDLNLLPAGFTNRHKGLLIVTQADEGEWKRRQTTSVESESEAGKGLRKGDYLVSINDIEVGSHDEAKLRLLIASSPQQTLKAVVIRNRELKTVEIRTGSSERERARQGNNYVLISGLMFQDLTSRERGAMTEGRGGIILSEILPESLGVHLALEGVVSRQMVLDELEANGKRFALRHLGDLRRAMAGIAEGSVIRMYGHHPVVVQSEEGKVHVLKSRDGIPVLSTRSALVILPVTGVTTSKQAPFRQVRDQFDFSKVGYQTPTARPGPDPHRPPTAHELQPLSCNDGLMRLGQPHFYRLD